MSSDQGQTKAGSKKVKEVGADWKLVMDPEQVRRSITRIAYEIIERNKGGEKLALVGIRTRGEFIGERVLKQIMEIEKVQVPFGIVDITLYRDDISHTAEQPIVRGTNLPFNLDKVTIVLVDDVLFTGRTIRAALDVIIDFGRPKAVQLAVLCDRGHRELPIRADYIGKSLPTARNEVVEVCLTEKDGIDSVFVRPGKKLEPKD